MYQCRITVVDTAFNHALAAQLNAADDGPCPLYQPGKSWTITHYGRPLDFCEQAWTCVHRFVYAILSGAGEKLGGRWMENGRRMYASCSDGMRITVFLLERLDEKPMETEKEDAQ